MNKPKKTSKHAIALLLPSILTITLMSLSGCAGRTHVVNNDRVVIGLKQGQTITAPVNGWFISDDLYLYFNNAVSDLIQIEQNKDK